MQKQQLWSVLFAAVILAEVILVLVAPLVGWGLGLSFQHFSAVLRGQITDEDVRRKLRPSAAEEPRQAAT